MHSIWWMAVLKTPKNTWNTLNVSFTYFSVFPPSFSFPFRFFLIFPLNSRCGLMVLDPHWLTSFFFAWPTSLTSLGNQKPFFDERKRLRIFRWWPIEYVHHLLIRRGNPVALWSRTTKNPDAHAIALLTHSLAPDCLLRLRAPLHPFFCSVAHTLTPELVGKWLITD